MSIFQAIVLGVVQGLTEFLPISSSAHLVLVPAVLGWDEPPLSFLVLLHGATLLALIAYFRSELLDALKDLRKPHGRKFAVLMTLGTIPAAAAGILFEKQFERAFGRPAQVAIQLVITGVMLLAIEGLVRRRQESPAKESSIEDMSQQVSAPAALAVGVAQALSIIPGISRSGATIAAGMAFGMSRSLAARFSFLLAVPILAGTTVFKVPDLGAGQVGLAPMIAGSIASLVSGYLAIAAMIGYLQRRGLVPFAVYCLIAGAGTWLLLR